LADLGVKRHGPRQPREGPADWFDAPALFVADEIAFWHTEDGGSVSQRQWETIGLGNASGQIQGNAHLTALGLKNSGAEDWKDISDDNPP